MGDLRDHSQDCEHGAKYYHKLQHPDHPPSTGRFVPCPGGREVIIDRGAAVLRLPEAIDAEGRYVKTWGEIVDLVVAAAIGDTE